MNRSELCGISSGSGGQDKMEKRSPSGQFSKQMKEQCGSRDYVNVICSRIITSSFLESVTKDQRMNGF